MNLDGAFRFANRWHSAAWRVGSLGDALGAEVRFDRMGAGTLGVSSQLGGARLISISDRVQSDPILLHAIILHEGGHFVTDTAIGACSPAWKPMTAEIPAWLAAAVLAVSEEQTSLHIRGRLTVDDIVEANAIPRDLARIGLNLREQQIGVTCRRRQPLMVSLVDWIAEMQQRLKALA